MKSRKKKYRIVYLYLFLALNVSDFGQAVFAQSKLSFDIFTQEDGLPNNQVQCIFQDSKGWMWIGTSQGLTRFDGYNYRSFLPNESDSVSLKGNLVRVIKEDKKGNLLVGTENGGLNIFDREKEIFSQPFMNYPDLHYQEVSVNDIVNDDAGNYWIGTDFNVLIIDVQGNLEILHPESPDTNIELAGNYI